MELFPYQKLGAEFLAARRVACLYDEMGLGKTAQAITACDMVGAKDILVVCRAVARENWRREFAKFSTKERRCHVVYGSSDYAACGSGVTVCSYEGLGDLLLHSPLGYDVVIVDEAHYGKEPNAARTRNVFGKTGAIHRGKQTFILTGTPTPNHAGELWTTLYSCGHTKLDYDGFLERYCTSRITKYGRQVTGTKTSQHEIAELRAMLKPFALRRSKEDVNLELPPISFHDIVVKPGKVDLLMCGSFQKYVVPVDRIEDLEKDLLKEIGVVKAIVNGAFTDEAMRALEAKSRSIMTLMRYNSIQKVEAIIELVSGELDAKSYDKIVIFAIYKDTIESLQKGLAKKYGAVNVYGGTRPDRLQARVDAFQKDPKCKVFVAQIISAGTSITLTAAHQVMFADLDWVPGNNSQAAARCHRIGQTKPVTVRCVSLENSIDQHIQAILARKTREINLLTSQAMPGQDGKPSLNQIL